MTAPAEPQLTLDEWGDPVDVEGRQAAYEQGYTDGHTAALAARPPATVWAPHATRWRHARPGDAFTGAGGKLWHLTETADRGGQLEVRAVHGVREVRVPVDRDEPVTLLLPVEEADAITLTADVLGARIVDRAGPDG